MLFNNGLQNGKYIKQLKYEFVVYGVFIHGDRDYGTPSLLSSIGDLSDYSSPVNMDLLRKGRK